jgi:hypothetical protein
MKLISFFILLALSSTSFAIYEELIKLSLSASQCSSDPLNYLDYDHAKEGFKQVRCPNPWNDRAFYRNVHHEYCVKRFGETGFNCVESDSEKIRARAMNSELMSKMVDLTVRKFHSYKEELVKECCGEKEKCTKRFSQVRLKIDSKLEIDARYYSDMTPVNPMNNDVVISRGKLASAYNIENIERVLLVELAHACHFALISESKDDYERFTHPKSRCDKTSGELMFKEGLGPELGSCVMKELERQISEIPETDRGKYCFGKWYREAFSDMKFRKHFTSPYHWTFDMSRRSMHQNYGSVFQYIGCGFPQEWKALMCQDSTPKN